MNPAGITQVAPDPGQREHQALYVMSARAWRQSPSELGLSATFDRPVPPEVWADVFSGYVRLHSEGTNRILVALGLPATLWKSGWNPVKLQVVFSDDRRSVQVTCALPERYEKIPDRPEVWAEPPSTVAWPFGTIDHW
jgi:hypothetical protein